MHGGSETKRVRNAICPECGEVNIGNRPRNWCLGCWYMFADCNPQRLIECRDLLGLLDQLNGIVGAVDDLIARVQTLEKAKEPKPRGRPRKDAAKT